MDECQLKAIQTTIFHKQINIKEKKTFLKGECTQMMWRLKKNKKLASQERNCTPCYLHGSKWEDSLSATQQKQCDKPIAHPPSTPPTHRRTRFFLTQYESDQIWIKHKMPMACFSCIDLKLCQWMYQGTLSGVAALCYMVLCTKYKPWSLVYLFSSHSLKIRPNSLAFTSVRLLMKCESILEQHGVGTNQTKWHSQLTLFKYLIYSVCFNQYIIHCFCHSLYSSLSTWSQ